MIDLETIRTEPIARTFLRTGAHGLDRETMLQDVAARGLLAIDQDYVGAGLLEEAYEVARRFFALRGELKRRCSARALQFREHDYVGYFGLRSETAVGRDEPDLKEFMQFCRPGRNRRPGGLRFNDFAYPEELPGMQEIVETLYEQFLECSDDLMRQVFANMGVPEHYGEELIQDCNSILRIIHYPPVASEQAHVAQRAAPHTGINLIGLQPPQTQRGLQYALPNGRWAWLQHSSARHLAVNLGEMLSYVTEGRLPATLHQVVNDIDASGSHSRYCIVFFKNANPRAVLRSRSHGDRSVGEWITARLSAIGIVRPDDHSSGSVLST